MSAAAFPKAFKSLASRVVARTRPEPVVETAGAKIDAVDVRKVATSATLAAAAEDNLDGWIGPHNQKWGPAVKLTMANTKRAPITHGGRNRFWLVDLNPLDAVYSRDSERDLIEALGDHVSVVDVVALGNMAKGTADWGSRAKNYSVLPLNGPHSEQDVTEMLLRWLEDQIKGR